MTFSFLREIEEGLIIVPVTIDRRVSLKMVLDTGATNTTIDSNALYLAGYALKDNIGRVEIETANGIIETELFSIDSFSSLGIIQKQFPIQVYDFLAHGIFSDYDGLLGLDFFGERTFCIDLKTQTISIS
jgi:hypothetical protein